MTVSLNIYRMHTEGYHCPQHAAQGRLNVPAALTCAQLPEGLLMAHMQAYYHNKPRVKHRRLYNAPAVTMTAPLPGVLLSLSAA